MRIGLDTNVLVHAEGVNDPEWGARAREVIAAFPPAEVAIPLQVLGELFRVLTGKARWPAARARSIVGEWRDAYMIVPTTSEAFDVALDLAVDHRLSIWDAVILNAAAEAGCRLLLSEDLAEGFAWRGLTVVTPSRRSRIRCWDGDLRAVDAPNLNLRGSRCFNPGLAPGLSGRPQLRHAGRASLGAYRVGQ